MEEGVGVGVGAVLFGRVEVGWRGGGGKRKIGAGTGAWQRSWRILKTRRFWWKEKKTTRLALVSELIEKALSDPSHLTLIRPFFPL